MNVTEHNHSTFSLNLFDRRRIEVPMWGPFKRLKTLLSLLTATLSFRFIRNRLIFAVLFVMRRTEHKDEVVWRDSLAGDRTCNVETVRRICSVRLQCVQFAGHYLIN